jgi:hypothetical protein
LEQTYVDGRRGTGLHQTQRERHTLPSIVYENAATTPRPKKLEPIYIQEEQIARKRNAEHYDVSDRGKSEAGAIAHISRILLLLQGGVETLTRV